MGRYTHVLHGQEQAAIEALPDFRDPAQESQKRTGTDDTDLSSQGPNFHLAKILDKTGVQERISANKSGDLTNSIDTPKTALKAQKPRFQALKGTTPERTRTSDLRFRKPSLYPG